MYRHLTEVVAFTGDAETLCPSCAHERYKTECTRCARKGGGFRLGEWHDAENCDKFRALHPERVPHAPGSPGYYTAWDGEGNEVTSVSLEEVGPEGLTCCACLTVIEEPAANDED